MIDRVSTIIGYALAIPLAVILMGWMVFVILACFGLAYALPVFLVF